MTTNQNTLRRLNDSLVATASGVNVLPWSRTQLSAIRDIAEKHVVDGETWDDAHWVRVALPRQYKAAASVFAATGEVDVVLDGLAVSSQVRRALFRVAFRSFAYLLVILFIASMLLVFFSEAIEPTLRSFENDLRLTPTPLGPLHDDPAINASTLVTYFSFGFLLIVVFLLAGGASRAASWFGGRGYRMNVETAMVLRVARRLAECGVATGKAVDLACELVGATDTTKQIALTTTTGSADAASDSRYQDNARYFQYVAESRIETMKVIAPVLLIACVGGTATLIYSMALFSPLVSLLHDLSIPTGVRGR